MASVNNEPQKLENSGHVNQTDQEKGYLDNLAEALNQEGVTTEERDLFLAAVAEANDTKGTDIKRITKKAELINLFPEEFQNNVKDLFEGLRTKEKRTDLLRVMTALMETGTETDPLLALQSALKMINKEVPDWLSDALSLSARRAEACEIPDGFKKDIFNVVSGEKKISPEQREKIKGLEQDLKETLDKHRSTGGLPKAVKTPNIQAEACEIPDGFKKDIFNVVSGEKKISPEQYTQYLETVELLEQTIDKHTLTTLFDGKLGDNQGDFSTWLDGLTDAQRKLLADDPELTTDLTNGVAPFKALTGAIVRANQETGSTDKIDMPNWAIDPAIDELALPEAVKTLLKNLSPELKERFITKIRTDAEFLEDLKAAATGDDPVLGVLGVIDDAFDKTLNLVKNYIESLNLDETVTDILCGLVDIGVTITAGIIKDLEWVWDKVKDAGVEIKDAILGGIQNAGDNIGAFLGKLKEAAQAEDPIIEILKVLDDTVENIAGAVLAYIDSLNLDETVKDILRGLAGAGYTITKPIIDAIVAGGQLAADLVVAGVEITSDIIDDLQWVWGKVKDAGVEIKDAILGGIQNAGNNIGAFLGKLKEAAQAEDPIIAIFKVLDDAGENIAGAVLAYINSLNLDETVKDILRGLAGAGYTITKPIIDAIVAGGETAAALIEAGVEITAETAEFLANAGAKFLEFFKNVLIGQDGKGGLAGLGAEFIGSLITAMKDGDNPIIDGAIYLLQSLDKTQGDDRNGRILDVLVSAGGILMTELGNLSTDLKDDLIKILKDVEEKLPDGSLVDLLLKGAIAILEGEKPVLKIVSTVVSELVDAPSEVVTFLKEEKPVRTFFKNLFGGKKQ